MATIDLSLVKGAGYFYTTEEKTVWQAEDSTKEVPSDAVTVGTVTVDNGVFTYEASSSSLKQTIDASAGSSAWIIRGTDDTDTINVKGKGTTFVDGRGGADTIKLTNSGTDVIIFASTSGNDTISGFDQDTDILYFADGFAGASATLDKSGNVKLTQGSASITTTGTAYASGSSFRIADSEDHIIEVTVASEGGKINATDASSTAVYAGVDGAVNFANTKSDVVIDLGNTGNYGEGPTFQGIVAATGANRAANIIVGAAGTRNTLQGGSAAENSLYGGGTAADLLVGGSKAQDVFYYGEGDGSDSIQSFTAGEDVISITAGQLESVSRDGSNVVLGWSGDGNGRKLTLVGGTNNVFTYTTGEGATRDVTFSTKTVAYGGGVDDYYYVGTGKGAVSVSGSDDVKLWLDGSKGDTFSGFSTLNAKSSTGAVELAGGTSGDSIVGGKGSNSLWGGAAGNDTLVGGTGDNVFWLGYNEGKDTITQYNDGDKVMLYNLNLGNVTSAGLNGKNMVIEFNDGSKLTVSNYASKGDMVFQLTDGTFTYDKSNGSWTQL